MLVNDQVKAGAEALRDSLTMLGVNPAEMDDLGFETTAEALARMVLEAAERLNTAGPRPVAKDLPPGLRQRLCALVDLDPEESDNTLYEEVRLHVEHGRRNESALAQIKQLSVLAGNKISSGRAIVRIRDILGLGLVPALPPASDESELHPHAWGAPFSAASGLCSAMVMRDGGGGQCGLPKTDPIHINADRVQPGDEPR